MIQSTKSTPDKRKIEAHSRVILLECRFATRENNPTWGSKYACEGTVLSVDSSDASTLLPIRVLWDNGLTNGYAHEHLVQVESDKKNPNLSFKLNKMRAEGHENKKSSRRGSKSSDHDVIDAPYDIIPLKQG